MSWSIPTPEENISEGDANPSSAAESEEGGTRAPKVVEFGKATQSEAEGLNDTAYRYVVKPEAKSRGEMDSDEEWEEGVGTRVMTGSKGSIDDETALKIIIRF